MQKHPTKLNHQNFPQHHEKNKREKQILKCPYKFQILIQSHKFC